MQFLLLAFAALYSLPLVTGFIDVDTRAIYLTTPVANESGLPDDFVDSLPYSSWTGDGDGYSCSSCIGKVEVPDSTNTSNVTLLCHFCPDPTHTSQGYCECTLPSEAFVCPILGQPTMIYGCGVGYSISGFLAFVMVLVCVLIMACFMTDDLTKELVQEKYANHRRKKERAKEEEGDSSSEDSHPFPDSLADVERVRGGKLSFSISVPFQTIRIRRFARRASPNQIIAAVDTSSIQPDSSHK
eukprot:CAMPEP_0171497462 /NCGR_PEP_ID=MMETSP0958-20121227/7291_1 /TAXON_ID=87120 /ORGANISM="Aurantiochytrium limacinum, Strain ATCCMYA-1381" /LENGTH=241 /DNA_ID=CAMNT_0012031719 /DNA_START=285 /DNA_END=1013 /DNA_ORIENTATION=-